MDRPGGQNLCKTTEILRKFDHFISDKVDLILTLHYLQVELGQTY